MRHYTKAEWGKIPEAYKGRWEPTPLNLERVKSGELPAEYIGKRSTIAQRGNLSRLLHQTANSLRKNRKRKIEPSERL